VDTKKLRQKILDLAIHGKLVPQDPNDEPASVLLERIKAEKERLIKEGKIKRTKKSTKASDTPHYPYLLPNGWEWCKFQDCMDVRDGTHDTPKYIEHGYPLITSKDFKNGKFDFSKTKYISSTDYQNIIKRSKVEVGDILYSMIGGNIGSMIQIRQENYFDMAIKNVALFKPYPKQSISTEYIAFFLESKIREYQSIAIGGAQPFVGLDVFRNTLVPLPPLAEQKRIVAEIERCFALIDQIEQSQSDLQTVIKQTQSKILDLAIHGKLVPQDPNDEPASELLKRINPKAEITCDNGHYPQLPDGWCKCRLEDIVEYEQPQAYIVNSTDYDDRYLTPVLTAGKSFVIGYTNETEGIYQNTPCIIFDDFTTDSKLVDFPFKVKSSAMKILKVADDIEIEYVAMFMNITRLIGDTHKRYWISEYSKLCIPIPPKEEQKRIINAANAMFEKLDAIMESL